MVESLFLEVARLHADQDRFTAEWLAAHEGKVKIHCARGCSNCCNLAVNTTFPEACLIARELDEAQKRALRERIPRLLEGAEQSKDLKSFLKHHRTTIGFCSFLDQDGACGIYPRRPLSCRSLLSTRPADWCAVDFTTLHPLEREAFRSGLDRTVVSFPSHYLAATQDQALDLEEHLQERMLADFDISLAGNLPYLVWLELEHGLGARLQGGAQDVITYLRDQRLAHPLLVQVRH